ncbi:MAG: glycosyltransferase family 2 protein [Solirubrobacteraceae bacterium]
MEVTVAVVSWNTRNLLLRCLESLASDVYAGSAQVWVVDNASSDGSAQAARSAAPWARVIDADANLGFGCAVNAVAHRTQSDWLLAANADVALQAGALKSLVAAGADPRVGCVAPRLVLPTGATQHSVHPFPTVPLTLAFNLGLHRVSSQVADRLCLEGHWNPERRRTVPWAIGACQLLRRAAFEAVGGFDGRQWMYAEDLDLGWRLHQHGWTTRYEPRARVLHESGAATAVAFGDEQASRFLAETYAMLGRRRGATRMLATAAINVAGAGARAAWMSPLAVVEPRWRGPSAESRRWLRAHLRALLGQPAPVRPR